MLNEVKLIGNVGKEPEVHNYNNSDAPKCVVNLSIATSETYVKNGEKIEQTEWHRVVLFNNLAEIAQKYVFKGMKIYINGKLKTRDYVGKDGIKRYVTEIWGNKMLMLSSSNKKDNPKIVEDIPEINENDF